MKVCRILLHESWGDYLESDLSVSIKFYPIICQQGPFSKLLFYRAMLCIRGSRHGPVSVCLSVRPSVTSRCSTKTAKRRITQTTPHDSQGILVFWCQRSRRNSTGVTPYGGAKCRWSGSNRRLSTNNRLYIENGMQDRRMISIKAE